jgi:hypothetical protein
MVHGAILSPNVETSLTIEEYDMLTDMTGAGLWMALKGESVESRWQRVESMLLSRSVNDDDEKVARDNRRRIKKEMKSRLETECGTDELCSNCFVLENNTPDGKLFRCGWCRQVNYCSRECQKEHWKKTHKKQCTGKK